MSELKPSWRSDEEEDEEDYDETNYISQKDAVLFAIDVSSSMLQSPPPSDDKKAGTDSPTLAAIKCAYEIMTQRIISSPKDMMGVLLFGTEKSKFQDEDTSSRGSIAYPHCYLLCDLGVPSAADVKELKEIGKNETDAQDLLVPSEEPASMSNMLFCANQIFTTRAPNFGSRRLFIITDRDDPHSSDKAARAQATVRAKDLYDLNVIIDLFPISHPDHEFDRSKFYDDIIYRDPAEGEDLAVVSSNLKSSGEGISLLTSLISDINSKQVAKRTLFSNLPFVLGPNLTISVKGYNLLQRQTPARSCYIYEQGEKLQMAEGISTKFREEDNTKVDKMEIKKAYKFGGSQVLFTEEQQKKLKLWESPVLRIIGFKPQSMLPAWASVKKATFIYPSEDGYIGSTRTFAALWQKLLKDKIMGLAWLIARANATPLIVAILPSAERFDDITGAQIIPPGLWLYPIPFADDVREPPQVPKPLVAPEELIDQMRMVVRQLQLPKAMYDPIKFPNPALQWHYKVLQAMALEEEEPTPGEDKTIPKYRQINKRAGEYITKWGEILEEQSRAYTKSAYGDLKRGSDADEGPIKKVKVEKAEKKGLENMTLVELKKVVANGWLAKYTVAELKEWLTEKGLNVTGKKGDLVDRVEQWVEEN
ncbi:related to ATP-dependent DNA helicase II, 70 kDa subunit [Rhynchosporium agropyri]|uniref:ATP-dependent DNA helicase II subunit 1 n=1 Tax=Rhynchosporium agropyri TaxID=914238 RepID=A0A1E1L2R9_9HELO|nr:related to ATP-dependent DNA helicase II, 70 kDa subunit [Rhynchosporium agropyri]